MVRGLVRVCKYERVNEVDLVLKQKDARLTKENGLVDSKDVMEYVAVQLAVLNMKVLRSLSIGTSIVIKVRGQMVSKTVMVLKHMQTVESIKVSGLVECDTGMVFVNQFHMVLLLLLTMK